MDFCVCAVVQVFSASIYTGRCIYIYIYVMMSVCVGCNTMMENGAINYKGYEAK